MKILSRYLLKEFIPSSLLGFVLFTFLITMERIFELVGLIGKGIGVGCVPGRWAEWAGSLPGLGGFLLGQERAGEDRNE